MKLATLVAAGFLAASPLLVFAREVEKRLIFGNVEDRLTRQRILDVKILVMRPDSTVIDSTRSTAGTQSGRQASLFEFDVSDPGHYLLRFDAQNYESVWLPLDLKFYKREHIKSLPTVLMKRLTKEKKLGEAVVSATRIKFYQKGDTLVYNADAFQLAEGSMLDALVRQLPGAELKDDGRIYVNGRFVESLMLNGKDFFKGKNSVMLDNLPSYMVHQVKVYEKQGELSALAGRNMGDKKSFVMDVQLKKQYSIGWIGNAETGLGTDNRYLARLFALRFTPQSRLTFFGTMNNLNDSRRPGQNGDWSPDRLPDGLTATKTAGMDYRIDDRESRYTLSGNALLEHSDADSRQTTSTQNFLNGNDTYGHTESASRNRLTNFSMTHTLKITPGNSLYTFTPSLSYRNYSNRGGLNRTTSDTSAVLNRMEGLYYGHGYQLNTAFSAMAWLVGVNHSSDWITLEAEGDYNKAADRRFEHYQLDYPSSSKATDRRQQFFNTPQNNFHYKASLEYLYAIALNANVCAKYSYARSYRSDESWLRMTSPVLSVPYDGVTPSAYDSISPNSYQAHRHDFVHTMMINGHYESPAKKGVLRVTFDFNLPIRFETNRLSYWRPSIDTTFSRHRRFFNPWMQCELSKGIHYLAIEYRLSPSAPAMTQLLSVTDDANPLYVTRGNAALRNTYTHDVKLTYMRQDVKKGRIGGAELNYQTIRHAVVYGYDYDRATGIRTTMPENVDGNWNMTGRINYSMPLDKKRRIQLNTVTSGSYYHAPDIIDHRKSIVHTSTLSEDLSCSASWGNQRYGLRAKGTWTHADSRREGFSTVNAADLQYGLTALTPLPWQMELSADATLYSRLGYADASMNTNDIVLNARLSKRVMHGRLTFMADGFDLLHEISRVTTVLTAQGRTETWRNSLPSYVMLHAIYRLNLQPKKKGNAPQ